MVPEKRQTSPGVRQCLKILSWISRNPQGLGFNELRERVSHIPSSTLSRHLKVLNEESWLMKNELGVYIPGPAFLCVITNLSGRPDSDGLIRPAVEQLAEKSGHSAAFALWERGRIRFRITKNMPRSYCYPDSRDLIKDVFSHPFGLTALASLPESVVQWNRETRREEFVASFGGSPAGEERFNALLDKILSAGYYCAPMGCQRICVPIRYGNGDFAGVLGLSLLDDPEPWIDLVKSTAQDIEKQQL
jgi:hypothetical protein